MAVQHVAGGVDGHVLAESIERDGVGDETHDDRWYAAYAKVKQELQHHL